MIYQREDTCIYNVHCIHCIQRSQVICQQYAIDTNRY